MSKKKSSTCFVRFDEALCTGCGSCMRVCPTTAIRIKKKKSIRIVDQCVGCGEAFAKLLGRRRLDAETSDGDAADYLEPVHLS